MLSLHGSRRTLTVGIASLVLCSATGAGAAALHAYTVSQTTGSGGATTFLQSSVASSALQGEVATSARTNISVPFGVLGEYDATNGNFGIGVAGVSTTGYGVGAESFDNNPALIAINAHYGDGIDAYAKNQAPAIYGESTLGGPGVEGFSDEADGVDGFSQTNYAAAISGTDNASNVGYGVYGGSESTMGTGVVGFTPTGVGVIAESDSGVDGRSSALVAYTVHSGTALFRGEVTGTDGNLYDTAILKTPSGNASNLVASTAGATNDLQLNGDIAITGNIYTACKYFPAQPNSDCNEAADSVARSSAGNLVQTYGAHYASPTMEDAGEARLTNGFAHVPLDPTFASTISTTSPYLVFTTPQGDGAGLFVSNRTSRGFDVRQSLGGRSNMTFDYRIVAHQFGRDDKRIALLAPRNARRQPLLPAEANRMRAIRDFHGRHPRTKRPAPRDLVEISAKSSR